MLKIITDSTSDITLEEAKVLNIDIVPLKVIFETESYDDGVDITPQEFYKKLVEAPNLPTTSQPSPVSFVKLFESIKANNDEAIVLTLSGKISGTVQSANIAKDLVEYDKIHIIDTLNATISLNLLVRITVDLRNKNMDTKEILNQLNTLIPKARIIAAVATLEYFVKGGRLSKTAGMAGKMLNLKPIVTLDDGEVSVLSKSRGIKKAIHYICDYIKENNHYAIDLDYPILFGYTGEPIKTDKFIHSVKEELALTPTNEFTNIIGSVIGTHAGPGANAIAYIAKEVKE